MGWKGAGWGLHCLTKNGMMVIWWSSRFFRGLKPPTGQTWMAYFNSLYFEDKVDLYKYMSPCSFSYCGIIMVCQASRTTVWSAKGEMHGSCFRVELRDSTENNSAMAAISWECSLGRCWEDGFLLACWDNQLKIPENRCCIQKAKRLRVRDIVLKNLQLSQTTSPDMMIALTLGEPLVWWP